MTRSEAAVLPDEATSSARNRRGIRWAVVAGVLALAGLVWWWSHPGVFPSGGGSIGALVEVGDPIVMGLFLDPARPIQIRSIRVHDPSGVRARVAFFGCDRLGLGAMRGSVRDVCGQHWPASGGTIGPDRLTHPWMIVAEVTLLQEGAFVAHGFQVSYQDGIRFGRQTTGPELTVYTTGHNPR